VGGVSVSHSLSNLVPNGPDGVIAVYLQHPPQDTRGGAALLPSHQKKDHPKPFSHGRSRLMEDGPRGEGGLVASCLALIKLAGAMKICMMMLTPWAMGALWQTQANRCS
jgi:hypothetical protein